MKFSSPKPNADVILTCHICCLSPGTLKPKSARSYALLSVVLQQALEPHILHHLTSAFGFNIGNKPHVLKINGELSFEHLIRFA